MKNSGSGNSVVRNQIDNDFKRFKFDDFAKVSKSKAKEIGQRFYYGQRCSRKHTPWRYTSNGECLQCNKSRSADKSHRTNCDRKSKMLSIDAKKEEIALNRQLRDMDL